MRRRERPAPVLRGRGSVRGVDQSSKSVACAGKGVHLNYVGGVVYAEWIIALTMSRVQGKACTCTTWAGKCTRNACLIPPSLSNPGTATITTASTPPPSARSRPAAVSRYLTIRSDRRLISQCVGFSQCKVCSL